MKQIIQSYKTGKMEVVEVPVPSCGNNGVLEKTGASLISAGTEKMLIDIAGKSLIGKAKARPDLVKQVLNKVKKEGLKTTIQKVMTKLEVPIPMGYSSAGEVLFTGKFVTRIKVDERVACAGAGFANHAEMNYVPKNLIAKIPDNVSDEEAAFTTVASIALQGVRQLNPTIGERIAVIGSGLIGLITVQLLKANGCDVLAVDIDKNKLKIAEYMGADCVCTSDELLSATEEFSQGYGVDGVIIAASSKSNQIIVNAGEICRLKGRVIMVGLTPMDIPRDIYYKKELDFRLSMSYGPGRYDPKYEIDGIDYPLSYVRWTEQRNMGTILNLVAQRKLDVKSLITHRYDFINVLDAYKLVKGEIQEPYLGIILQYHQNKEHVSSINIETKKKKKTSDVNIGFIGAGSFAQAITLPNLVKTKCSFDTLLEPNGVNATVVIQKYGFRRLTTKSEDLFGNKEINTIFITTPHSMHAEYVIKGLKSNKHIFVEKPLSINEDELNSIKEVYKGTENVLMVGYNRRFSPHAKEIRKVVEKIDTPVVMNYIVNAGQIPVDHWIQDIEIGGGRIIGEVCHFVDFLQYISGSNPVAVYATSITTKNKNLSNNDSLHITIDFADGSIGNITYHALGDTSQPKEYFELAGGGYTVKMHDFRMTQIAGFGKLRKFKTGAQQKGFKEEYQAFEKAIIDEMESPISFGSLYLTTLVTFRALESIQTGLKLFLH
ncbi:MAG: bi-domain-containing oxidoreductase [Bacteroidetes bacterium]|nr:bi-domain-containing oxidoreductase [Bacteroidota bacterium]